MAKGSEKGGCLNCYAAAQAVRFAGEGGPFHQFARRTSSGPRWTGKVALVEKHLHDPLHWRESKRIFVNSMSDLFHENLPFSDILRVHISMLGAEQHQYQVLTKRPEIAQRFYLWWDKTCPGHAYPKDLYVGTSVENQKTADLRIPYIATLPTKTFISYEPALGPVDFWKHFWIGEESGIDFSYTPRNQIDWLIVGGESGHGARPFDIAWARQTIKQCRDADVACFVKQLGAKPISTGYRQLHYDWGAGIGREARFTYLDQRDPKYWRIHLKDKKGGDMAEWAEHLRVREYPR